jgi:hypothetical protein
MKRSNRGIGLESAATSTLILAGVESSWFGSRFLFLTDRSETTTGLSDEGSCLMLGPGLFAVFGRGGNTTSELSSGSLWVEPGVCRAVTGGLLGGRGSGMVDLSRVASGRDPVVWPSGFLW